MFADQISVIDLNNYVATESSFWKLRCGNRFLNLRNNQLQKYLRHCYHILA